MGLLGDVGNVVGGWLNYKGQKQANETNLKIARENNAFNEKMWNMQNEYNTPAAQMQRLREAGLNPNLMYSMADSGNAGAPPTAESVRVENTRPGDALMNITTGAESILNIIKRIEEIRTQKASTLKTQEEASSISRANSLGEQYDRFQRRAELYKIYSDVQHNISSGDLTREQINTEKEKQSKIKKEIDMLNKDIQKRGEELTFMNTANRLRGEGEDYSRNALEKLGDFLGSKAASFVYGTERLFDNLNGKINNNPLIRFGNWLHKKNREKGQ